MDLAGRLQLGSLRLKGLDLSAVDLQLALAGGQLTLKQFSAGWPAAGDRQRRARCPSAAGPLSGAQAGAGGRCAALLQTLAQTDLLEGKGDLEVEAQGSGLSEQALRSRMQGKVSPQAERRCPARHQPGGDDPRGASHPDRQGCGSGEGGAQDRFQRLTASFRIADGVARSDDIQLFAPPCGGEGSRARPPWCRRPSTSCSSPPWWESSKGQGGKTVDELKDITIPVRIGGHWQVPSYRLDVKELLSNNKLLEEKARKEAERGLKKLLGDKADNEGVKGWPTSCSGPVQIASLPLLSSRARPVRALLWCRALQDEVWSAT